MKEHPRLVAASLAGTVLLITLAFIYTQTPRPEVIAPVVEAPSQEAEVVGQSAQGTIYSGSRGLDAEVNGRTVTITGPAPVLEKIDSCVISVGWFGPGGNGLSVEWGDGTTEPLFEAESEGESCSQSVKTHTYKEPGAYTIIVTLWHPGPADEPITDWEDSVVVTVD
ncbi:MAG TPA: hypothetical protein VEA92_02875 [Candidatus Paceibacterota bacterium]|nr:hypothetical protein [Candidatus Paceibacterota bacterium]